MSTENSIYKRIFIIFYQFADYSVASKYLRWMYSQSVKEVGRVHPQIKFAKLTTLPIPVLDLSVKTDKAKHDNFVSLVSQMLDLKKQEQSAKDLTVIQRRIKAVDRDINKTVYELYDLTPGEVATVENVVG
jgi:hypothetical protein